MAEKKYLDEVGLAKVADHVNTRLKTVTAMPVSADEGAVRLYVGEDTADYFKGHIYQYNNNIWKDITSVSAEDVSYDNAGTGFTAVNVQDAIDELNDVTDEKTSAAIALAQEANDKIESLTADEVAYDNTDSGMTSTNVQDAVDELSDEISQLATGIIPKGTIAFNQLPALADVEIGWMYNISDDFTTTNDFVTPGISEKAGSNVYCADIGSGVKKWDVFAVVDYSASNINYDNTDSGLNATNVQDAIDELDNEIDSLSFTADAIEYDNTDSGLTATNVQDAIDELDNEIDSLSEVARTGDYDDLLDKPSINGKVLVGNDDGKTYSLVDRGELPKFIERDNSSLISSYSVIALIVFNNTLYVGTENHGIYTSTDGSTFTQNASLPSYSVYALTVFNNILYVGTSDYGIYTSTDGSTFTQNTSFPTNGIVNAFIVFNNTLYVGTNYGIYTSTDGSTFTKNTSFPTDYIVLDFTVFNNTLYVGTSLSNGIYTSTDGSTFTQNESFPNYNVYALIVFNNTLYAGTYSHGIYTSTDGSTFTQNISFPTNYIVYALTVFNNTLYVGTGGYGIYTSTDGSTFTQNTSFPTGVSPEVFTVFNNTLYIGTYSYGIYTLENRVQFLIPRGTIYFSSLPALSSATIGDTYNISDDFTTNNNFIISSKSYKAGTSVYCTTDSSGNKKWSVFSVLGTAAYKNSTNQVTDNSTDLVESGAVKSAIDTAISSVYKPAGNKTCAELVAALLVSTNLGNVYNITDSGTTTVDFVEGAGKTIEIGDNVVIVDIGSAGSPSYKFDLLSGMIDLSNYNGKITVSNDTSALTDSDSFDETPAGANPTATKRRLLSSLWTYIKGKITGAVSAIVDSDLTASRALISDANGKVAVSDVTSTELGYLDGVTSAIQTQLNGKQATLIFNAPLSENGNTVSHSNSGATAGSYGDSAAQTPSYGATFKVPYITVNTTGHITAISEHTVKIPDSDNTDTKVTQNNSTTNADYRVLLSYGATNDAQTNTVNKSTNLQFNPNSGELKTTKVTVGNTAATMQYNSTTQAIDFIFN